MSWQLVVLVLGLAATVAALLIRAEALWTGKKLDALVSAVASLTQRLDALETTATRAQENAATALKAVQPKRAGF